MYIVKNVIRNDKLLALEFFLIFLLKCIFPVDFILFVQNFPSKR